MTRIAKRLHKLLHLIQAQGLRPKVKRKNASWNALLIAGHGDIDLLDKRYHNLKKLPDALLLRVADRACCIKAAKDAVALTQLAYLKAENRHE